MTNMFSLDTEAIMTAIRTPPFKKTALETTHTHDSSYYSRPRLCKYCGIDISHKHQYATYCSRGCLKSAAKQRRKQETHTVFERLANGSPIQCAICGCPHEEALTIGHFNGNGKAHRKQIGKHNVKKWILTMPIEEVLAQVRIECVYCNFVQQYTGGYPSPDKRPRW